MSFGKVLVEKLLFATSHLQFKLLFATIIVANDSFSTTDICKILGVCDNKHTSQITKYVCYIWNKIALKVEVPKE